MFKVPFLQGHYYHTGWTMVNHTLIMHIKFIYRPQTARWYPQAWVCLARCWGLLFPRVTGCSTITHTNWKDETFRVACSKRMLWVYVVATRHLPRNLTHLSHSRDHLLVWTVGSVRSNAKHHESHIKRKVAPNCMFSTPSFCMMLTRSLLLPSSSRLTVM